ncbi:hypothetical protein CPB84DRAFT_1769190 [Gymnopilus junonius]|uniref:Uncharacterized protein n=1 Tax=Gymnopilus junonius TaxID=109634 RepID=A0A9P5NUD4_GYMJU|nr:hypothetical protein CPB84DRAFT_1769190 [Gymnopilus junonius]
MMNSFSDMTAPHPAHQLFMPPDPRDRGACARFRLCRKARKAACSTHLRSSGQSFQQLCTLLDFVNSQLQYYREVLLEQARLHQELASSYSATMKEMTNHLIYISSLSSHAFSIPSSSSTSTCSQNTATLDTNMPSFCFYDPSLSRPPKNDVT